MNRETVGPRLQGSDAFASYHHTQSIIGCHEAPRAETELREATQRPVHEAAENILHQLPASPRREPFAPACAQALDKSSGAGHNKRAARA